MVDRSRIHADDRACKERVVDDVVEEQAEITYTARHVWVLAAWKSDSTCGK